MERDNLGPPVVPGGRKISLGSRNLRPRAEARPTGRAVSKERLRDWDGQLDVCASLSAKACQMAKLRVGV